MSSEERCPTCGSFSRNQILCSVRHQAKPFNLSHVMQLPECRPCTHPWHSPAPVDAGPKKECDWGCNTVMYSINCPVHGDMNAKAPAPAEGAEQFDAALLYAKTANPVPELPYEYKPGCVEPECIKAKLEAASLRERLAQAQVNNQSMVEMLNKTRETLLESAKALSGTQRELEEARALLHDAVLELGYVHSMEDISQVISPKGEEIVNDGMKLLGLKDLSDDSWWYDKLLARSTGTKERGESK